MGQGFSPARHQRQRETVVEPAIAALLHLIDEAYDHTSWHGTNLRGSIRGLSHEDLAWRPARRRHNVWEIVVHAAYWKYAARRRLLGEKRGGFPLKGSNWFDRPGRAVGCAALWRSDLRLLAEEHRTLRQAVSMMTAADLDTRVGSGSIPRRMLVTGAAAHDLYHAGQIQLLKRLRRRDGE